MYWGIASFFFLGLEFLRVFTVFTEKKKKKNRCETEDFVGIHLCKLRVSYFDRAYILVRVSYVFMQMYIEVPQAIQVLLNIDGVGVKR